MPGPEQELFVYYRAAERDAAPLEDAVRRMQDALRQRHPSLSARLLRRPQERDGLVTWMEAYAWPTGGDPAVLLQAVADAATPLAAWIVGERHVEHFVPCAS
jgi:hypothetical protein